MPSDVTAVDVDEELSTPLSEKAKKIRPNPTEWSHTVPVFDITCERPGDSVIPEEVLSVSNESDIFKLFQT